MNISNIKITLFKIRLIHKLNISKESLIFYENIYTKILQIRKNIKNEYECYTLFNQKNL